MSWRVNIETEENSKTYSTHKYKWRAKQVASTLASSASVAMPENAQGVSYYIPISAVRGIYVKGTQNGS